MASNDVRDVLNLPADGLASRPSKKQKTAAPRPNLKGLAREVQSLGGDNPIAIVPEVSLYKKRRFANRKPAVRWELRPFKNSARGDQSLVLRHWTKKTDRAPVPADGEAIAEGEVTEGGAAEKAEPSEQKEPELEDSAFVKFNVKVDVPEYNEEQYNSKLQSDDWTKEETDYLMELCRDYDLRWPIIWDRYEYTPKQPEDVDIKGEGVSTAVVAAPKLRATEDLKARYYHVAAKMMEVQKPRQYMTQAEWDLHSMMMNFNPEQERQRKKFALNTMSRSKEEAKEEESLLIEVKRIMARAERFNEERRELYQRLDYPHTDADISAFKGSAGLSNLLTNLQTQSMARKRKPLAGPEVVTSANAGPSGQPSSAVSENAPSRRDSIAAQSAGHRDSIGAEKATPIGNKKGQPPPERRKLSDYEEQIYGVSTHERLSSGPTFRYERVNKLFSHKSGQQQQRIQNVLNELGIPVRLNMPTATVVAEYEKLVLAVTNLVDSRKHRDKVDSEIKIEEAKKAERAKARAVLGLDGTADEPPVDKKEGEASADTQPAADSSGDKPPEPKGNSADKGADAVSSADPPAAGEEREAEKDDTSKPDGKDGASATATTVAEGGAEDKPTPVVKEEEEGARPESSSGHRNKRSASVLSATSDRSAKKQKK